MSIRYISTRGLAPALDFESAVLAGLAPDGGLYVPETLPQFSAADIAGFATLSYADLAVRILSPFTEGALSEKELRGLVDASYATFDHPDIAPLQPLGDNRFVLELFHGPTLAFKDFALQFLGRLLNHILQKRGSRATVIGATSGDTGSAAIAGCRGRKNMDIFILFPEGRVSEVQRRQMTTVLDANVHNIALAGTFDDCQNIVKALFTDSAFREKHHLTAVNSINWARILAQVVYYFYAAAKLGAPQKRISFAVPTGNFGDIYAGYLAKKMGLPVERLIIATNSNDILTRCVETGTYGMSDVVQTPSPSMDIQVSSNFERLLFDLYDRDGKAIVGLMAELRQTGAFSLLPQAHARLKKDFDSASASNDETLAAISDTYKKYNYLLDPHTAVAVAAAEKCDVDANTPLIVLATAHPAKFPDAVEKAAGVHPVLPKHLADLFERKERFDVLPSSAQAVQKFIESHAA